MNCTALGCPTRRRGQFLTDISFRHQIYFEKIHPSVPMIHKFRYLAAMNL
jgi:hypothetical protein